MWCKGGWRASASPVPRWGCRLHRGTAVSVPLTSAACGARGVQWIPHPRAVRPGLHHRPGGGGLAGAAPLRAGLHRGAGGLPEPGPGPEAPRHRDPLEPLPGVDRRPDPGGHLRLREPGAAGGRCGHGLPGRRPLPHRQRDLRGDVCRRGHRCGLRHPGREGGDPHRPVGNPRPEPHRGDGPGCPGLAAGGAHLGDLTRTICLAVQGGWDTHCKGATAGSIFGAMHGTAAIPDRWIAPFADRGSSASASSASATSPPGPPPWSGGRRGAEAPPGLAGSRGRSRAGAPGRRPGGRHSRSRPPSRGTGGTAAGHEDFLRIRI
nr:MAG: hypothetical protein DIU70_13355 [Bacillota bacterium]